MYAARRVTPRLFLSCLVMVAASGCIYAYQPLVGLQRPVALDTAIANFEGQKILVRCVADDVYLDSGDAERLCRQMRSLFTNQGAAVTVDIRQKNAGWSEPGFKPDLIIELRGRLLNERSSNWSWLLCYASLTLIPAEAEYEFAQDIIIRDASGFMLASDSLQGRFVRQFGLGTVAVNGLADLIVRPKNQRMTGDGYKEDFTKDFYGQVSQLAFQASMRSLVMREFAGTKAGP